MNVGVRFCGVLLVLAVVPGGGFVGAQTPAPEMARVPSEDSGEKKVTSSENQANCPWDGNCSGPQLVPHRKNYLLPLAYNESPDRNVDYTFEEIKKPEVKFQVSIRFDLKKWEGGRASAAYTNLSFWQAYNWDESAPFRTTNHEPELFVEFDDTGNTRQYRLGFNHQSNGESGSRSRSWNRLVAEILFYSSTAEEWPRSTENGWRISVKPWWNFASDEKNNGNINDYLGYFELSGDYVWALRGWKPHVSVMLRNNLHMSDGNRGALQVDFSALLYRKWKIRWMVQYFNGYGESLVDYDHNVNRLSVGFEFSS